VPPAQGDYIFVIVGIIVLTFVALAPIILLGYVLTRWSLV
jgi:hypothetical protein